MTGNRKLSSKPLAVGHKEGCGRWRTRVCYKSNSYMTYHDTCICCVGMLKA